MSEHESCGDGCGRRAFIRESAAILALTALLGPQAHALPIRAMAALTRRGARLTYPIPAIDGVTIDRNEDVILARTGGQIIAFALTCPHQNTALRWQQKAGEFQCPKHKSRYKPDGVFIAGRATRAMDRFAIQREGETVVVDVDRLFRADVQPAEWSAAVLKL
jgi:Rieske Fe-S protein